MDSSTASSPTPSTLSDVEMQQEQAESSSIASSTSSLAQRQRSRRPPSTSPLFVRYSFWSENIKYTIQDKSVSKKGGAQPSHIWRWGAELSNNKWQNASWLCKVCWDKDVDTIYSSTNTTRPAKHLLSKHRIQNDSEVKEEASHNCQPQAGNSMTKSVLQKQHTAAAQHPNQLTVDNILRALIQWIVLAHIALNCVELNAFKEFLQLLNPVVFSYLWRSLPPILTPVARDSKFHEIYISFVKSTK